MLRALSDILYLEMETERFARFPFFFVFLFNTALLAVVRYSTKLTEVAKKPDMQVARECLEK